MSDGVEWALHCCTLLATIPPDRALTAARLAEFHEVPPHYLAKHLQALVRAGVLVSVPGPKGGFRLARPAAEISLLEVVEAIDGAAPAFRCTEIRQRGPAACGRPSAYRIPCSITTAMRRADDAWKAALEEQSVGDLVVSLATGVPAESAVKAAQWFQEVSR